MCRKHKRVFAEFAAEREYIKGLKKQYEEAEELYQEKLQKYLQVIAEDSDPQQQISVKKREVKK